MGRRRGQGPSGEATAGEGELPVEWGGGMSEAQLAAEVATLIIGG